MIILYNGMIIKEDKILEGHSIEIEGEIIKDIIPNELVSYGEEDTFVDCTGKYISPGFIDIHSDYIENIVSPRPITVMNFNFSLRETERILVTSGITTMYHSLSLYPENDYGRKAIRHPENIKGLIEEIDQLEKEPHIIHNRVHLRYELSCINDMEMVANLIREQKIHLLSFMDHTPGQGQYANLEVYKKTQKSLIDGMTDKDVEEDINMRKAMNKLSIEEIQELARIAHQHGLKVASHDDDSIEKLDFVESIGATISEFPISLEIAKEATKRNLWTVAGAPNLLQGKSHSGNLSAQEGILNKCISIISSDYYPSAVLVSLFAMHEKHQIPLYEMFKMVTVNPAKAVGIEDKVGTVAKGKAADLLVIEKKNSYPAIKIAMVDGHIVFETRYRYDS